MSIELSRDFSQVAISRDATGTVEVQAPGPQGPQGLKPVTYPGAALVFPEAGMSTPLGRTRSELAVSVVRAVVSGDPGVTATVSVFYGPRNAGTVLVDGAAVNDQTTGQMLPTVNGPVPGGSYIWAIVDDVTGGILNELILTFED